MKNLLGMLGIAAAVAVTGNASAQEAAAADAAAAPANAEAPPAPFGSALYVSPQFTYTIADKDRLGKNGYGGTLGVGSRLSSLVAVELSANYTSFKNDSTYGGSSKFTGVGGNVLLFPFRSFLPNLYGLVGGQYSRTRDQPIPQQGGAISQRNFNSGDLLAGVGYWQPFTLFGVSAALRLDADYRLDLHDRYNTTPGSSHRSTYDEYLFSAGLVIPLFPAPPPTAPAPPPPAETPAVVPVAEAAPPPAEEPPPPPPAPACRAPIAGEKVDLSGCASGDVIVLRGVNFDFDKATLTPNAKTILDQVADALKAAADIKVEIGGHTDGKGSSAYNQKLSQKRADSVKAYLVDHGIDAGRMTTKGYGKEHPIADNKTDEGRELNRRVELKVMD